jgi:photosystem II stability/assembly factor-like uncharacterized protein
MSAILVRRKGAAPGKKAVAKTTAAKKIAATRPTAAAKATAARKPTATPPQALVILIATRKGAWFLRADASRKTWRIEGPHFHGHIVNHLVLDPRDGRTLLAAAKTGHLGPTIFRSTDFGATWSEATQPPAFDKKSDGTGRSVDHTFWLTPGHASERDTWYAGTSPQGLFRSSDGGVTWAGASPINDDPTYIEWMGTVQDGTPDGPKMHSIIVDPRDPKHLYFGMSGGGVHESVDGGQSFRTLIDGLEVVEGFPKCNPAMHDPHCIRICPSNPNRLYQQNHCGTFRLDRPSSTWQRIGSSMPKSVGDIGFTMVVHPRDDKTAWVLPMDGSTVWPRTSPGGKPSVYVTRDAGKRWQRQDQGLPAEQAWWTVKRQAMTGDARDPVGLYFGTTSGEVWASRDEGASWRCVARHLPEIYALEVATPVR